MNKKNMNIFAGKLIAIHILLLIFSTVEAASVPRFGQVVSLTAKEEPIGLFLQELFGQIEVPVIVDPKVEGAVNGSFNAMPASRLFNDISKTFGLVMYYDGAVVHIYTANDLSRRILPVPTHLSRRIIRNANDLRLTDNKNNLRRANDGGLVVTGTERFIQQINELVHAAQINVRESDSPITYRVFYLKYAWAQDVTMTFSGHQVVVPGVATILRSVAGNDAGSSTHVISHDQLIHPSRPGLRGQGLGGIGTEGRLGMTPENLQLASSSSANQGAYSGVATTSYDEKRVVNNGNITRIEADTRLNAIIVRDAPEKMTHYEQLIDALDIEPQMLEIEATIIDINTDRLRELGVNWRWQNNDDEVLFGNGTGSDVVLRPNSTITDAGRGGFISFVLGDNAKFIGRINALEAEGAAKVVSRPHVLTLSNVEAIFDNSSTFYVRIAGREEVDLFDVSVGTRMRVTPHVFKDDGQARIKLLITIEDGQKKNEFVDNIPVIENSAINTQALINAGESILIGGLVREVNSESTDRIPLLGDIPVLGNLFKTNSKSATHVERMFLISPRLASSKSTEKYALGDLLNSDSGGKEKQAQKSENENAEDIAYRAPDQKAEKEIVEKAAYRNPEQRVEENKLIETDFAAFDGLESEMGLSCEYCD